MPVSDDVIFNHLSGKQTIGIYPLLTDDHCYFLAVDFDKQEWREDAGAFMQSCRELDIPAALEISRSGNGAHIWIFFAVPFNVRKSSFHDPISILSKNGMLVASNPDYS
ncbi:MAG: hypothetical protein Q9M25_06440 [Mariprofundaceae bacterium]|nr:hypothetical protein [Mariprofundaceae bacterium]